MRRLPAICLTAVLAASAVAHASSIGYTFEPGTSATFAQGVDTFTGTFTFDTLADTLIEADVVVSGPVLAGTYTYPQLSQGSGAFLALNPNDGDLLYAYFNSPLAGTVNPLAFLDLTAPGQRTVIDTSVTGGVAPAPTPEPASLLLLATGILGMAAIMGRRLARD